MSALWPLQAALATRLQGDTALMARISGVFDGQAPQGTTLPFVVIGEPTELPVGNLGPRGWSDTITVHVWSGYQGRKEALEIAALISTSVETALVLDGHTAARLRQEFATVLVEADGVRHAPIRYRALTFEAA